MTQIETSPTPAPDGGRLAAIAAYGLYLLSIPSLALFAPAGLIVALYARGGATGWVRTHFENQINLFWIAFWWGLGVAIAIGVSALLTIVLIGFPLLWLFSAVGFIVMVWFTVMSAIGLLKLLNEQPA